MYRLILSILFIGINSNVIKFNQYYVTYQTQIKSKLKLLIQWNKPLIFVTFYNHSYLEICSVCNDAQVKKTQHNKTNNLLNNMTHFEMMIIMTGNENCKTISI